MCGFATRPVQGWAVFCEAGFSAVFGLIRIPHAPYHAGLRPFSVSERNINKTTSYDLAVLNQRFIYEVGVFDIKFRIALQ